MFLVVYSRNQQYYWSTWRWFLLLIFAIFWRFFRFFERFLTFFDDFWRFFQFSTILRFFFKIFRNFSAQLRLHENFWRIWGENPHSCGCTRKCATAIIRAPCTTVIISAFRMTVLFNATGSSEITSTICIFIKNYHRNFHKLKIITQFAIKLIYIMYIV